MRKKVALNDEWFYKADFSSQYLEPDCSYENFTKVTLPHSNIEIEESYFEADKTRFISTYVRNLYLPESYNGTRLSLSFDGILSYAEVYINGEFVASHKGDTPFMADITAPVKYEYNNIIVVKTDSCIRKDIPSPGFGDPIIQYGGIHRLVSLEVFNGEIIEDVFVKTTEVLSDSKSIEIDVELFDYYPDTTLHAEILDGGGMQVGILSEKSVLSAHTTLRGVIDDVSLWTLQNPTLYTARVVLSRQGKILDSVRQKFGFRSCEFKRNGFYLNNVLTKLIGLNRVDAYPVVGRSGNSNLNYMDAKIIREEIGCNVVRTLGFASKEFIQECDRIGLLVIPDIVGDGYLGKGMWRETLLENISEIVKRDRNSPSVICYGVRPAPSPDCAELFFKTSAIAKKLDPTRQSLGTRSFMGSHMYEDIFGFNDYPEGNRAVSKLGKTSKLFVPYIVTEHTGKSFPTKMFDKESTRLEHAMRHLSVINKVYKNQKISGAIGMSLSDFHSVSHKGGGDSINYYGIMDIYRNPKLAYYAYQSQFANKPMIKLSSDMSSDEFSGTLYAFTNCDYAKLYRDGKEIGIFKPDKKKFAFLPHPPIKFNDLLGNLPSQEGFTHFQTKLFKYLVRRMSKSSILNFTWYDKLTAKYLSRKKGITYDEFRELLASYSLKPLLGICYKVEGYIDDKVCAVQEIGKETESKYNVTLSNNSIVCKESVQAIKLTIECVDENLNRRWYDFSPIQVSVSDELRILGESNFSLKGGVASVYIEAKKGGKGAIVVESKGKLLAKKNVEVVYEAVERI